jgi:hypothetical protein
VALWRAITLTALGVSFLCFFLPWVRYSIVIPFPRQLIDSRMRDPLEVEFGNKSGVRISRDRVEFEFASQSGLQTTFALFSLQPALDRWVKMEMEKTESEWRQAGKNPMDEWLKRSKPFMAPWLLLYPLALGIAGFVSLVSRPGNGSCLTVGGLVCTTGLLLLVQFGMFGPPVVSAFYDHFAKEGSPGAAFLLSLVLDVRYTFWFGLAVFGIVVAIVTQVVFFVLVSKRS